MLSLHDVYSYYGSSPILKNVSIEITQGSIVGVLGRNGVGKTTLLKTIMGMTDKVVGQMAFEGQSLVKMPTYKRAKLGIGYIPQGREIIPNFTIHENLKMGTFGKANAPRNIPEQVFEIFPVLKQMINRKGGDLSGGQQQQLAIARALCMSPKLLLLDEPTEGIQPNIVAELEDVIVRLNEELDITILLVEQNIGFIKRSCSSALVIEKGEVAFSGEVEHLTEEVIKKHMTV